MQQCKDCRIAALVDAINTEHATGFELLGKMERGTNGAYLVKGADGVQHILKLVSKDDVTAQISRSAKCAEAVNSAVARTPRYELVGYTDGMGAWYVQEFLPGIPSPSPSLKLVDQLIAANELQAGKAVDCGVNWSERVRANLFEDAQGWQKKVAAYDAEGESLVNSLKAHLARHTEFVWRADDIVHGDYQHYNALVDGDSDELTGYVDWEGAGCGDRAFDLARLLFDVYVSASEIGYPVDQNAVAMLTERIESISGRAGLSMYLAYWILQVAEFGVRLVPDKASMFFEVGNSILALLD